MPVWEQKQFFFFPRENPSCSKMELDKFIKMVGWRGCIQQALIALYLLLKKGVYLKKSSILDRLLLQRRFQKIGMCYLHEYSVNATTLAKKYTEVLGKESG